MKRGVAIIEALVLIFVFSISALAFYSVFTVAVHYITSSKNKLIAISLINERMELLRNIGYDDVAIDGGIPDGDIDPDEYVIVGDKTFHLFTDIRYFDDPDDGVFGGIPNDAVSNDYKIVSVSAFWGSEDDDEKATLSSKFVPAGVETSVGGGTLSLNAIDSSGSPVANVSINIFNNQVSPNVNYTTTTDANGNLLLQGVPTDIDQNYKITFSKSGHETITTFSPSDVIFVPEYAHISIMEGALNTRTMVINLLSDLNIKSVNPFGSKIDGINFTLTGGKRLDDGTSETAVYNYSESLVTDSNGDISIDNISPGVYKIELAESVAIDYLLWKGLGAQGFNLQSGADMSLDLILIDRLLDATLVSVADSSTGSVIEGASVTLRNDLLGYNVTLNTDEFGNAYFPENTETPLVNGEVYNLEISAPNYEDNSTTVTINGLTEAEVNLIAN